MEDAIDRIDPLPAPSACLDGIQRHMQQYEQSISRLQLENNELRERLAAALQQLDLYRMQPGQPIQQPVQQNHIFNASATTKAATPAPQTVVQPPAPLQQIPKARKLVLHSRAIIQIVQHKGLLLTSSKDGTARIWREDGASLHCFRTDAFLSSAGYFDGILILASKHRKVFIHQTAQAGNLIPFADVLDLNSTLLRDAAGTPFLTVPEPAMALARLGTRVFAFGAGFFTCAEIGAGFQVIQTQQYTEQLDPRQPLQFISATTINSSVFISVKEKFIQKGQFLPGISLENGVTRTGARLMQLNSDFSITAHTLQIAAKGELTPVNICNYNNFVICVFPLTGFKFAALNVQNGKFLEIPENSMSEVPSCCVVDGKRLFVGCQLGGLEKAQVVVFGIEISGETLVLKKEKNVIIDDLNGSISSLYVKDNMVVAGGVGGEVLIKGW